MNALYDAILLVSFGGPEGQDDVMPFLENVLRGRNVSRERMIEVAEHYQQFDGISPINQQNRELMVALERALTERGPQLPIYWGNRNWHPMLSDTIQQMKQDGIQRALSLMTSAFSCYSGCRQYREDVERAQGAVGSGAPHFDKLRVYFNHPGFVGAMIDRTQEALSELPAERRRHACLVFTAHSIPVAMAERSHYVLQLEEVCRLVSEALKHERWKLVYQSRSGPPTQPWLEPDVCDFIRSLSSQGTKSDVAIIPIGFISDHMEVLFDLDTEARGLCQTLGVRMVRAKTIGTHPMFVEGLRQLIEERAFQREERPALGRLGPSHDVCPDDCCLLD